MTNNSTTAEIYLLNFLDSPLAVHTDQASSEAVLADAGFAVPTIPAGCNTVLFFFETKDGFHALAVNQAGFVAEGKEEEELNGCSVYVCLDTALNLIIARCKLQLLIQHILAVPPIDGEPKYAPDKAANNIPGRCE
jgi:hypothetical protein